MSSTCETIGGDNIYKKHIKDSKSWSLEEFFSNIPDFYGFTPGAGDSIPWPWRGYCGHTISHHLYLRHVQIPVIAFVDHSSCDCHCSHKSESTKPKALCSEDVLPLCKGEFGGLLLSELPSSQLFTIGLVPCWFLNRMSGK